MVTSRRWTDCPSAWRIFRSLQEEGEGGRNADMTKDHYWLGIPNQVWWQGRPNERLRSATATLVVSRLAIKLRENEWWRVHWKWHYNNSQIEVTTQNDHCTPPHCCWVKWEKCIKMFAENIFAFKFVKIYCIHEISYWIIAPRSLRNTDWQKSVVNFELDFCLCAHCSLHGGVKTNFPGLQPAIECGERSL